MSIVTKPSELTVKETMRAIARAMNYGRLNGFLPVIHVPLRTDTQDDDRVASVYFRHRGGTFKAYRVEVSNERAVGG